MRRSGILVVDDKASVRSSLQLGLRCLHLTPWLAADGTEAVHLFSRYREAIAGVLLDVRMPGLDGVETLRALRHVDPSVTVCFMSGALDPHEERDLLNEGVEEFLAKPFRLDELSQVLGRILSRRR